MQFMRKNEQIMKKGFSCFFSFGTLKTTKRLTSLEKNLGGVL